MAHDQADGLRAMMGTPIGEFPDVPKMVQLSNEKYLAIARQDDMREVVFPLIETATNEELQQIVNAILFRAVDLNGLAPELEDWLVSNARMIESEKVD